MGAYGPPAGFYRSKRRVRIDPMLCTACMRCVQVCPKKVFGAKRAGDKVFTVIKDPEGCAGCNRCVNACLTNAVNLYLI